MSQEELSAWDAVQKNLGDDAPFAKQYRALHRALFGLSKEFIKAIFLERLSRDFGVSPEHFEIEMAGREHFELKIHVSDIFNKKVKFNVQQYFMKQGFVVNRFKIDYTAISKTSGGRYYVRIAKLFIDNLNNPSVE